MTSEETLARIEYLLKHDRAKIRHSANALFWKTYQLAQRKERATRRRRRRRAR